MRKIWAVLLLVLMPFISWGAVYQTVMVDSNRAIRFPSNGFSSITLGSSTITSWTNLAVTNVLVSSNWAAWVATTNVDMNGYDLTNAASISAITGAYSTMSATTAILDNCSIPTGYLHIVRSPFGVISFVD
jgi:hypothetical protein